MPHLPVADTRLWVEDHPGDGPPVLFSHGLLWSCRMFDAQVAALRGRWRCIAYDHRGQGLSDVPPARAHTVEQCTADAAALIEQLDLGPVHFVGLSMGGFVGMRLAARRPDLVRSLTLLNTSAETEPAGNLPRYRALNRVARWLGLGLVADRVMPILFGRTFLTDPRRAVERVAWRRRLTANRRAVWRAVNGVIEREAVVDELPRIACPVQVLVGEEDVATVPAKGERIVAAVPGAQLVRIAQAGHSSTIEQPAAVTAALERFLGAVG
jgi:pimeloyl-ACP methyl ester carboxylesterase